MCDAVFSSRPMLTISLRSFVYHGAPSPVEFKCLSSATDVGQLKLVPTESAGVRLTTRWIAIGAITNRCPGRKMCAPPPVNGCRASSALCSGPVSNDAPSRSRFSKVGGHTRMSFAPWCAWYITAVSRGGGGRAWG